MKFTSLSCKGSTIAGGTAGLAKLGLLNAH